MSDLELQGFAAPRRGADATPGLRRAGATGVVALRRRRLAAVTGVAVACVLAVAASWCCATTRPRPWNPSGRRTTPRCRALEYPGPVMEDPGCRHLRADPVSGSRLPARPRSRCPRAGTRGRARTASTSRTARRHQRGGARRDHLVRRHPGREGRRRLLGTVPRRLGSVDHQASTPESLVRRGQGDPGLPDHRVGGAAGDVRLPRDALPAGPGEPARDGAMRTCSAPAANGVVGGSTDNADGHLGGRRRRAIPCSSSHSVRQGATCGATRAGGRRRLHRVLLRGVTALRPGRTRPSRPARAGTASRGTGRRTSRRARRPGPGRRSGRSRRSATRSRS